MDNVTHTVVGLAVGELIHRSFPAEPDDETNRVRRRLFLSACALASNFPDLDLILSPLIEAPLGNLLMHRGHTHTVIFAIPQALLLLALMYVGWPKARSLLKVSHFTRVGLGVSVLMGFALHLSMDYLNSYGLHPFYPFDSRWFYGDMIFIVEPLFWVACATPLIRTIERRWLRWTLMGVLFLGPVVFTLKGFLLWPSFAMLLAIAFVVGRLQRTSDDRRRRPLVAACLVSIAFIGLQDWTSYLARNAVADKLRLLHEDRQLMDSALTSTPTNPFCWSFVSFETSGKRTAGRYHITSGQLSLLPSLLPVEHCPVLMSLPGVTIEPAEEVLITKEESGDWPELRHTAAENCHVGAWLRFARMPMLSKNRAWDARYSMRANGANFTAMDFVGGPDAKCSRWIPNWTPPRQDVLTDAN